MQEQIRQQGACYAALGRPFVRNRLCSIFLFDRRF